MSTETCDCGFTLIETIVALVIFVACYLLIQEGLSLGWRGVRATQAEATALQVAQSRLAVASLETPLAEGQSFGESADGYAWRMDVRRRDAGHTRAERSRLEGFWVTVEVTWHNRPFRPVRSVQLTTLKLMLRP